MQLSAVATAEVTTVPVGTAPTTAPAATASEERAKEKADQPASRGLPPGWTPALALWARSIAGPRIVLTRIGLAARPRVGPVSRGCDLAAGWSEEVLSALLTITCAGRVR